MKSFLHMTATTPVGKFEGFINSEAAPVPSLESIRDGIQKSVESLNYLVIYSSDGQNTEITLPGTLIKRSVLSFKIIQM